MFLAAFNFGAAKFVRADFLCIDRFATCDQRGRSIDHIDHVCVERVDLSLARFNSAAGVHFIASGFQ